MRAFFSTLLIALFLLPVTSFGYDHRHYEDENYEEWYPRDEDDRYFQQKPWRKREQEEKYYYSDGNHHGKSHKDERRKHRNARAGWDVDPDVAKHAPNCHHYSLTVTGGKATARITPLPGKNYIQTHSQRVGYVCFADSARLELGKLANPGTEVRFRLRDVGTFVFSSGDRGAKYKNNWYRTYWDLH